jgi:hypothetical protein
MKETGGAEAPQAVESALGQSHRFGRALGTSGLPATMDIVCSGRHVSKVPTLDIMPKVAIRSEADLAWRYRQRKNAAKKLSMVRKPIPIFVIVYLGKLGEPDHVARSRSTSASAAG